MYKMVRRKYARKPRRVIRRRNAPKRYRSVRKTALSNYFKYKRHCDDTTLINNNPGEVKWQDAPTNWNIGVAGSDDNGLFQFPGVMKFQLNDVIKHGDFTALYDRYKITGVKVTFIPLMNQGYVGQSSSGNTNSATIPTITYAIDYDDSALPLSSMQLLEKMDSKVRRLDRPFSIYIKSPKVAGVVNADSGNVAASFGNFGYANCANDDVNFRGFKFWIRDMALPDPGAKLNSLIRVQTKYYLAFKDPQ